jgi:hypothetical protein
VSDSVESLQAECRQANLLLAGVVMRMDATQKIHDSAAFLGNGAECDKLRQELHELLDQRLDHNARVMQLTRRMMEL